MKLFWGIVLILAVAAGVLLARGGGAEGPRPAEDAAATVTALEGQGAVPLPPSAATAIGGEADAPEDGDAAAIAATPAKEAVEPSGGRDTPAEAPPEQPVPDAVTDPARAIQTTADDSDDEPATAPTADHDAEAAEVARQVAAQAAAAREAAAAAAEAEASGPSTRLNETWTIPGDGTAEHPYQVPWDLLVSAGREYNPREGKTELPAWAAQLDGKHVRLTGFLLFPIVATDADELLVMYNQWDGCCIGIPPTPYDSVEVKLSEPAAKDAWRYNYGSVTGTLDVDPYLAGKWLVSLYVLEGAELEAGGL